MILLLESNREDATSPMGMQYKNASARHSALIRNRSLQKRKGDGVSLRIAFSEYRARLGRAADVAADYDSSERYLRIRSGALPQGAAGRTAPAHGLTSRGAARARPHQRPARLDGGSHETQRSVSRRTVC